MRAFQKHTGLVVAMDRSNVDTDQIIPKQFLKRIERTGFGQFLFYDWRFLDDGSTPNPDFELNQPEAKGVSILLAKENFGSGSSREHAPWALDDYGFRVLIARSFADIFFNNCFKNSILPLVYDAKTIDDLFERAEKYPGYQLTADLVNKVLTDEHGLELPIEIEEFRRHCLLNGLDDIGLTLQRDAEISAYEAAHGIS
ncbi:3-isopropylmalate dehydratase small subunit [Planctomycetales bacterium 10988]|nr:3-isopropylmalate dehydratase small subunit [Planctomycetales bacterium 10988]